VCRNAESAPCTTTSLPVCIHLAGGCTMRSFERCRHEPSFSRVSSSAQHCHLEGRDGDGTRITFQRRLAVRTVLDSQKADTIVPVCLSGTGNFTAFIHLEDDIRVRWPALVAWAADTVALEPYNLTRGFIRTEVPGAMHRQASEIQATTTPARFSTSLSFIQNCTTPRADSCV
jgi:hypothetical protein